MYSRSKLRFGIINTTAVNASVQKWNTLVVKVSLYSQMYSLRNIHAYCKIYAR